MLTQNSYIAFDTFSPHTKPLKGNLKELYTLFESIDIDYEIVSVEDTKKSLSYQSVSNNPFIDKHLQKDIVAMDKYRKVTIKKDEVTFNVHINYINVAELDVLGDVLAFTLYVIAQ